MTSRDVIEIVLAALMVLNLLAVGVAITVTLRRMANLAAGTQAAIAQLQSEVAGTMLEARRALADVQKLSTSIEEATSRHLVPTLEALKAAANRIELLGASLTESAVAVRKVTGMAESIATPAGAVASAVKLLASPSGRAGLLTALAGAAAKAFLSSRRHQNPDKT